MYAIAGQAARPDSDNWQALLQQAHASSQRPLCLCRPGGVAVGVAQFHGRFYIRRLPLSGAQHAPHCQSYDGADGLTLRSALVQRGRVREQHDTLRIRLAVPLSRRGAPVSDPASVPAAGGPSSAPKSPALSLDQLLWLLLEEAGLTRWERGGRFRTWPALRAALLEAAARIAVKRAPLADRLLLPEPFQSEQKAAIFARRRSQLSAMTRTAGERPGQLALLIGECKLCEPVADGYRLRIRHLPERPLWLPAPAYARLCRRFGFAFDHWRDGGRLLLLATIGLSQGSQLTVDQAALLALHPCGLPLPQPDYGPIIDAALAAQRSMLVLPPSVDPGGLLATDTDPPEHWPLPFGADEDAASDGHDSKEPG